MASQALGIRISWKVGTVVGFLSCLGIRTPERGFGPLSGLLLLLLLIRTPQRELGPLSGLRIRAP